jgi:hypothetical protein
LFLLLTTAVVAVALITSSSHFNFQFFLYTIKIINENFFIFILFNYQFFSSSRRLPQHKNENKTGLTLIMKLSHSFNFDS